MTISETIYAVACEYPDHIPSRDTVTGDTRVIPLPDELDRQLTECYPDAVGFLLGGLNVEARPAGWVLGGLDTPPICVSSAPFACALQGQQLPISMFDLGTRVLIEITDRLSDSLWIRATVVQDGRRVALARGSPVDATTRAALVTHPERLPDQRAFQAAELSAHQVRLLRRVGPPVVVAPFSDEPRPIGSLYRVGNATGRTLDVPMLPIILERAPRRWTVEALG